MADSSEVVQVLTKCLENCETNKALEIFQDPSNKESLIANSWDIIPLLCSKLDQETIQSQPAMFSCCVKLLGIITELASPEEALLEFIELAECPDNDVRFLALLKPLHRTLARMPLKRGQCLEWCLNLVANHVAELPDPSLYGCEGSERKLLDLDPAVRRAVEIYDSITQFYDPFISFVSLWKPQESADKPVLAMRKHQRFILAAFIFRLLGKPLVLMDLECDDDKTKSKVRCIAEGLVDSLKHVMSDVVPVLTERAFSTRKDINNYDWVSDPIAMFCCEEKVPMLGLSNLMYLVLAGGIPQRTFMPLVYSPEYVFQIGLHFSTEMLQKTHDLIIHKGLFLANALVSMISEGSLARASLDLPVHHKFCVALEKVIVYCEVQEYRQLGVKILQNYILRMDLFARYQVFLKLFPLLQHSGVKGVLVTMFKDTIRYIMGNLCDSSSAVYRSKPLLKLIEVFSTIPNGPEVDLMDHSDHILSLLNLMWFLAMADQVDNLGLWQYAPHIDQKFIHPLKEALKLSRAHYELKIHHLEEERMTKLEKKDSEKGKPEISVTVRGESMFDLTYDQKMQILSVALNKFSMMETLLTNIKVIVEHQLAGGSP